MSNFFKNILLTDQKIGAVGKIFSEINSKMSKVVDEVRTLKDDLAKFRKQEVVIREIRKGEPNIVEPEHTILDEEVPAFIPNVDGEGLTLQGKDAKTKTIKKDFSKISEKLSKE